ncbi:MAG TPA: peptidylprolyl isomerase [Chitinophagaceae bacterium]|nr:peptidylprolyl isomerase [Chitinophagaceae bacterium]
MQQVKAGNIVKVHYSGRLTDGSLFDSSEGKKPLEFQVGAGKVIVGFDNGVINMVIGEKKTIHIPVEEAYGPKNPQLIITVEKEKFPQDITPEVGMELSMTSKDGHPIPVVIKEVKEDSIVLDANHPLSGEALIFDVELVEIV